MRLIFEVMLGSFLLLVIVGKLIKAPFFFLAVGSKANVGGAASAPVVLVDDNNAETVVPVDVVLVVGVAIMAVGVAVGVPVGAWSISPSAGSAASIGYGLVAAFD